MKILDITKKGLFTGLIALLPMVSQAGLIVAIDDLSTGGIEYYAEDQDGNDLSGTAGKIIANYSNANGDFTIVANSDSPEFGLSDVQLNSDIVGGSTWQVTIIDDSYFGLGVSNFNTTTTPTTITAGTIAGLTSVVNGTVVLNQPNLPAGVITQGNAAVNLTGAFSIFHFYTFTNTTTSDAEVTLDTITTVPEPASLILFSLALMGMALVRKKYYAAQ